MWGLFNSRLPNDESRAVILDDCGPTFIPETYKNLGIRQGWLKRTGWYRDHKDRLVYTYKHIVKPDNPKLP